MLITREIMIKKLSETSGYYQKDIKVLLQALDEVVFECLSDVTDEEDVFVQLVKGIKCGCKIVPERTRKDPRTQDDIICRATVKPFAKFSDDFRVAIQNQYEERKGG